jgi:D-tyrosyl-tRNA(Tyr) deacylase
MRVVIQRVSMAKVEVDNTTVGQISKGLLILLGITHDDSDTDIDYIIKKSIQLRIFNDVRGIMNLSVQDIMGEILVVSQFTLYADIQKGNRPSYIEAAKPSEAETIYHSFIAKLTKSYGYKIATGIFGADMKITILNDGPITICIDSRSKQKCPK